MPLIRSDLPDRCGALAELVNNPSVDMQAPGASRAIGVLVVDDNDDLRSLIGESLRRLGYVAMEVADAEAAMALLAGLQGPQVDVILSDLNLPGLSGDALALLVQERWPHLKILLMSGETVVSSAALSQRILRKPFRRVELAQAISDLLGPSAGAAPVGTLPRAAPTASALAA